MMALKNTNGTRISVWNIPTWETGLPFQTFCCSLEFSTGTTLTVVFHLLSSRIFRKRFANGKQPKFANLSIAVEFVYSLKTIEFRQVLMLIRHWCEHLLL